MEQNIFTPKREELFKELVNSKYKEFNLNLTLKDIKERENNYTNVAEYWINKKFYSALPILEKCFSELYLKTIYDFLYEGNQYSWNIFIKIGDEFENIIYKIENSRKNEEFKKFVYTLKSMIKKYENERIDNEISKIKEKVKNDFTAPIENTNFKKIEENIIKRYKNLTLNPSTDNKIKITHKLYKDYYEKIKNYNFDKKFYHKENEYSKIKKEHSSLSNNGIKNTTKTLYEIKIEFGKGQLLKIDSANAFGPYLSNTEEMLKGMRNYIYYFINKIQERHNNKFLEYSYIDNTLHILFYNYDFKNNKIPFSTLPKKELKLLNDLSSEFKKIGFNI